MQERLQKILAEAGVASRRAAERLILDGRVKVNGTVVSVLGAKADIATDKIECDGRLLTRAPQVIYAFYKPAGVTSTMSDPNAKKTISDYFKGKRVYPVGRLDKYSEGLLLVTNDGALALELTHPRYEHEKEYEVIIRGKSDHNIVKFSKRFVLDGYQTRPMRLLHHKQIKPDQWLVQLVLKEGRKRQIRKIAEKIGYQVIDLKRVRMGKLKLGDLAPGEWRQVSRSDII
jgi:23S rRNA pseudouridine2605 synthase